MEFTQYKCPVCDKQFESGDDVVVCPECGAPHHRSCYEQSGHCFYRDRHDEGFSFESLFPHQPTDSDNRTADFEDFQTIMCPICFHKNPMGSHTCERCGTDLSREQMNSNIPPRQEQPPQNQGMPNNGIPPFGFAAGMPNIDPLGGLNSNEDVGEGVTAGEAAKFTGKNTAYFSVIFQRLKQSDRSKFSFAAFIFGGIYFLYRKMYGIGILFSLLVIISNVLSTFIIMTPEWSEAYRGLLNATPNDVAANPLAAIGTLLYIYSPVLLNGVRYVLMIISGLLANRLYYRHSIKKINSIKTDNKDCSSDEVNTALEAGGGVNLPLALSFGIATIAIAYICNFFIMTSNLI